MLSHNMNKLNKVEVALNRNQYAIDSLIVNIVMVIIEKKYGILATCIS